LLPPKYFFPKKQSSTETFLRHEPFNSVTAERSFIITTKIVGLDTGKATVQINKLGGGFNSFRTIVMTRKSSSEYYAEVPADLVTAGELNYKIILQKGNEFTVFPGNHKENPFAWDNYNNETWQTFVVPENAKLEIFNPTIDRSTRIYPAFKRGFQISYIAPTEPNQLILRLSASELSGDHTIGFAYYFGDKLKGRISEMNSFDKLLVRAITAETQSVKAKITLINKDAFAFSTFITLTNSFQDLEIPLNNLKQDSMLLMPRPYPEFMPLRFKASGSSVFNLSEIEKIQITIGSDVNASELKKPYSMEIGSMWLEKRQ
jgi:hypothetical protein